MTPCSNDMNYSSAEAYPDLPPSTAVGGKTTTAEDHGGSQKAPGKPGVSPVPELCLDEGSWGKKKGPKAGAKLFAKKPAKSAKAPPKSHTPTVEPTPGSEGYLIDCQKVVDGVWTLGKLQAAYPSEAISYKKRREYASTHKGWLWDTVAWPNFRAFLSDMGPKDDPKGELDRIDTENLSYGPGLCRWATKVENANNKTTNIEIVEPVTGKVWTSHKLAEKLGVKRETIYKRRSAGWSDLEMIVGTRDPILNAIDHFLKEKGWVAAPIGGTKAPKIVNFDAVPQPAAEFWQDRDEQLADECLDTGESFSDLMNQRANEYEALKVWVQRRNSGLQCSPEPPPANFYRVTVVPSEPGGASGLRLKFVPATVAPPIQAAPTKKLFTSPLGGANDPSPPAASTAYHLNAPDGSL